MLVVILVLCIIVIILWRKLLWYANAHNEVEKGIWARATEQTQSELDRHKNLVAGEYELKFADWKSEHTEKERASAVKISRAVNRGLVSEQFAPYLTGWPYNPKDCAFSGKPIDYFVFNGLDTGLLKEIVLVDVKTGEAKSSPRQNQIKKAVEEGRVRFEIFKPGMA